MPLLGNRFGIIQGLLHPEVKYTLYVLPKGAGLVDHNWKDNYQSIYSTVGKLNWPNGTLPQKFPRLP